jgi:hypothetical protein
MLAIGPRAPFRMTSDRAGRAAQMSGRKIRSPFV